MINEELSNIAKAHNKVREDFLKNNKTVVLYTEYVKAINDALGYEFYPVNNIPLLNPIGGYVIDENTTVDLVQTN